MGSAPDVDRVPERGSPAETNSMAFPENPHAEGPATLRLYCDGAGDSDDTDGCRPPLDLILPGIVFGLFVSALALADRVSQ